MLLALGRESPAELQTLLTGVGQHPLCAELLTSAPAPPHLRVPAASRPRGPPRNHAHGGVRCAWEAADAAGADAAGADAAGGVRAAAQEEGYHVIWSALPDGGTAARAALMAAKEAFARAACAAALATSLGVVVAPGGV
jgi:hypothetical protein